MTVKKNTAQSNQLPLKKNVVLEKQLAVKNHELEIETALERVRAVAMEMSKPDDPLDICKAQFNELKKSGFAGIRNIMISSYGADADYFLDYDYSGLPGAADTKINYALHTLIKKNTLKAKRGTADFFETVANIKAHGGVPIGIGIKVETKEDEGSGFIINLPVNN